MGLLYKEKDTIERKFSPISGGELVEIFTFNIN